MSAAEVRKGGRVEITRASDGQKAAGEQAQERKLEKLVDRRQDAGGASIHTHILRPVFYVRPIDTMKAKEQN